MYTFSMRGVKSFEIASDSDDVLDEIVIAPENTEIHRFLHPSMSSPINFCDNNTQLDELIPSTSSHPMSHPANENLSNVLVSAAPVPPTAFFSNQLTTDSCSSSKNSKSRRAEYSRGMQTCSTSGGGSCNPSQDSAFGSMTEGDLSVASSSIRMSSFQSMSSPIDESVEDSLIGIPGPSLRSSLSRGSTTSNNESMDVSDYCSLQTASASDFNLSKKKSASFGTTNTLPIEPPTILVNDKNSIYTTSPAKTLQVFSQKYRVSSFEDMSIKRNFLRSTQQNYRSLEEERRIDSAFIPIANHSAPYHQQSLDSNSCGIINNAEKFKKLTHVSFASKISSTRERHIVWKNSILARKHNLIKSNESLHDYTATTATTSNDKMPQSEYFGDAKLCKRVCSSNELSSVSRTEGETRYANTITENLKYSSRKSCSERYLWNMTMLRQSTIVSDYEECDEDDTYQMVPHSDDACSNSSSSGCVNTSITCASTTSNTRTGSTESSPSHRSMCKIIGGIDTDSRHIDEKVPLLDSMEMSPISPVESDEML